MKIHEQKHTRQHKVEKLKQINGSTKYVAYPSGQNYVELEW